VDPNDAAGSVAEGGVGGRDRLALTPSRRIQVRVGAAADENDDDDDDGQMTRLTLA